MLKGIPSILSPDLFKILMEMGHGDEIVLADCNFPASTLANRIIRADGHRIPELLEAIIKFFPLDYSCVDNAVLMSVTKGVNYDPVIWNDYKKIIVNDENFNDFVYVDRFAFYERAKKAYAIIATGENARFSNIILKKGIIQS